MPDPKTPAEDDKKPAKKPAAKKPAAKAETAKKPAAKKPAAKKAAAKKPAAKTTAAAKKPAAKPKTETSDKPAAKRDIGRTKTAAKAKPTEKAAPPIKPVVRASAKYVRVAPRKARLIADQVRGMQIEKARALLQFSPRHVALDIQKLINSAAANAENNHNLVADEMLVSEIRVDEGPTLRRFRPRAQGRATRINKRTCHISVALTPED